MAELFNGVMRAISSLLGLAMMAMGGIWILQGLNIAFLDSFSWPTRSNGRSTALCWRWLGWPRSCGAIRGRVIIRGAVACSSPAGLPRQLGRRARHPRSEVARPGKIGLARLA